MKKTISIFLYLMIVTGMIFSGCSGVKEEVATETEEVEDVDSSPPGVIIKLEGFDEETTDEVVEEEETAKEEEVVEEVTPEPVVEEPEEKLPPLIEEAIDEEVLEEEEVAEVTTMYADGSYSSSGSYQSPAGSESISVTLVVKDDKVSSLSVVSNAVHATSKTYQGKFISGINSLVVGKSIEELGSFSQVNGSSLTPNGFKQALNSIKSQALS